MSSATKETTPVVPPEEVARRIAWWRQFSYEHRAPAIYVYAAQQRPCPWPGCSTKIAGIDFHLDQLGDPAAIERWMAAWWQGAGLVGRCPGCRRHVQFGIAEKHAIQDAAAYSDALLPDDWFQKAHLALQTSE